MKKNWDRFKKKKTIELIKVRKKEQIIQLNLFLAACTCLGDRLHDPTFDCNIEYALVCMWWCEYTIICHRLKKTIKQLLKYLHNHRRLQFNKLFICVLLFIQMYLYVFAFLFLSVVRSRTVNWIILTRLCVCVRCNLSISIWNQSIFWLLLL